MDVVISKHDRVKLNALHAKSMPDSMKKLLDKEGVIVSRGINTATVKFDGVAQARVLHVEDLELIGRKEKA